MKNIVTAFCLLLCSMTVALHGARRGYQWTLDRAQMDRSRRIMRDYPRPRPVPRPALRYTPGPRPSLQQWTQDIQAQELADMGP